MKNFVIVGLLLALLSCHKKEHLICRDDLLAFDHDLNFRVNDCLTIDSLRQSSSRFGDHVFFSTNCEVAYYDTYFVATGFKVLKSSTQEIDSINIVFMDYNEENGKRFLNFCYNHLNDIFKCNRTLRRFIKNVKTIDNDKVKEIIYHELKFRLFLTDDNLVVLSITQL